MNNNISIYTVTLGTRNLYLHRLFNFIDKHREEIVEWNIGVQGNSSINLELPQRDYINIQFWNENCGAGEANNRLIKICNSDIICKLDDDALPYGDEYFKHIKQLFKLTEGKCIFSPYPVGLINNPGGVPSKNHKAIFGKETNTWYTLRKVPHIGGFARIMPAHIAKQFTWPYDYSPHNSGKEDVNFSQYCISKNIEMFYLENAIVVEHQESTIGQHSRYGESYFKGRF